jgi:hypothetical protein
VDRIEDFLYFILRGLLFEHGEHFATFLGVGRLIDSKFEIRHVFLLAARDQWVISRRQGLTNPLRKGQADFLVQDTIDECLARM